MVITPKRLMMGIPAFLVLIQLVGPRKTNPPVVPAEGIEAHLKADPEVSRILERACRNCHSHQTQWPWYSNVAPVSWFVIDNVNFGRRKMNLSTWDQYDREETVHLLEEMCALVEAGEMPLRPYLWMHEEARLSEQDVRMICRWSQGEVRRVIEGQGGSH
ncbi:MAG: heme-binding domain-containing protein [Acidobacteria bacterium]|nr:heme-binding domain-containing protein [Acidobacteriota bacterium]